MLKVDHLSIFSNQGEPLLSDLSFVLSSQVHMGLISEEGNGKSTLLKVIMNQHPDYVQVKGNWQCTDTIAYLPQHIDPAWLDHTPVEFLFKPKLDSEMDYEQYNEWSKWVSLAGSMGIKTELLEESRPLSTFSGGELVQLQLLKLQSLSADLYLLDEPTNDLDIGIIEWLENWIKTSPKTILFVSHDTRLLQNCAQAILHLERRNKKTKPVHTLFQGSYDDYLAFRQQGLDKLEQIAQNEKREYFKKKQRTNDILQRVQADLRGVSRQAPHVAKNLKDKMRAIKKQAEHIETQSYTKTDSVEEAFTLTFPTTLSGQARIVDDVICTKLHQINFSLYGNRHIAIYGRNGVGKSLFLKALLSHIERSYFYMPQTYFDDQNQTPIELLGLGATNLLGHLHFLEAEMKASISELSLGQQAKLRFAQAALTAHDVLILDEPTRNISPLSHEVICQAIASFEGAVVCVSHDRDLLARFDEVYELKQDGLQKRE